MKLTNRDAQRMVVGLRRIDEHEETKLSAETRLKVAVNINRLMPQVRLFEKEVSRLQQQAVNGATADPVKIKAISDELDTISEMAEDYKLKKFTIGDFDLKSNPKIKSETLSMIGSLIKSFDDGEGDED